MLNFYTICEFPSNFLCNWHELYYSPTFFFVYLYQPIHWYLTRILTFLSEQRAPFSTMFTSTAFNNVIWSQHSNVQVSIFVTCLNFVMTWYLAFKPSGRTAKLCDQLYRANCRMIGHNCTLATSAVAEWSIVCDYKKLWMSWPRLLCKPFGMSVRRVKGMVAFTLTGSVI